VLSSASRRLGARLAGAIRGLGVSLGWLAFSEVQRSLMLCYTCSIVSVLVNG